MPPPYARAQDHRNRATRYNRPDFDTRAHGGGILPGFGAPGIVAGRFCAGSVPRYRLRHRPGAKRTPKLAEETARARKSAGKSAPATNRLPAPPASFSARSPPPALCPAGPGWHRPCLDRAFGAAEQIAAPKARRSQGLCQPEPLPPLTRIGGNLRRETDCGGDSPLSIPHRSQHPPGTTGGGCCDLTGVESPQRKRRRRRRVFFFHQQKT